MTQALLEQRFFPVRQPQAWHGMDQGRDPSRRSILEQEGMRPEAGLQHGFVQEAGPQAGLGAGAAPVQLQPGLGARAGMKWGLG